MLRMKILASVVPLAIAGNERIPPRGSLILNPGIITVSKLPAITPEQYQNLNTFQLKTMTRDMIYKHLERNNSNSSTNPH